MPKGKASSSIPVSGRLEQADVELLDAWAELHFTDRSKLVTGIMHHVLEIVRKVGREHSPAEIIPYLKLTDRD